MRWSAEYADRVPIYRQSAILEWETGIELSRATMDGWVMRVGELLTPVVAAMRRELLEGDYIRADETPVGVQMHDVDLVGLSAEEIPLDDASFDCVVVTYTLFSVPDPVTALKEMRRVLKTGGRFLFCEHGRAPDESVRRWQDRLTPYWKNIAGGCHLNRDIAALISEAGFACRDLQTMYLPGPRPLTYNYWGEAVPA